jgi:beta-lactamase superfamily II metal-dependent hydrolase
MSLEIKIWDVKHGSSAIIKTPNNKMIAYDLGVGSNSNNDDTFSPISYLKSKIPNFFLDLIIISHPDRDHIYDILNVEISSDFRCWERPKSVDTDVKLSYEAASSDFDKEIFKKYLDICNRYNKTTPWEAETYNPKVNGNVEIYAYFPILDIEDNRKNNHSIVIVIKYQGFTLLLSGDNEKASWKWLIANNPEYHGMHFLQAIKDTQVLLAPHHGRESGFSDELLSLLEKNLRIVLISDGPKGSTSVTEKYSLKTKGMIIKKNSKLEQRKVVTTRNDGRIKLVIENNSLVISTAK